MSSTLLVQEDTFHIEDLFSASGGTKESQSVLLALAVSQVPLKNQYTKMAYFGVAYSPLL